MLDTNIVSDLIRNPYGKVADRLTQNINDACVSIIVAAELRFGAEKRGSKRLLDIVEGVLDRLPIIPMDVPVDREYAEIRSKLEAAGKPIGPNDLLIAAHALSLGATLVTDNVQEFERVGGLWLENWLQ